ncbi:MAG: Fe-S cluster assembly protein SufD [bacterium]
MAEPKIEQTISGAVQGRHLVHELARLHGELPATERFRTEAMNAFRRRELPDRVTHLWRYSDPELFVPRESVLQPHRQPDPVILPKDGPAVVLRSGCAPIPNKPAVESGIVIGPLGTAATDLDYLGDAVPASHGYFEALNGASWNAGVVVRITRNLDPDSFLRLVIPADAPVNLPRILVVVEDSASGAVVEDHLGGRGIVQVIAVSELIVGQNASLNHLVLQRWEPKVRGYLTVRARLSRDSRYQAGVVCLGGDVAKLDVGAVLTGPGARSELTGVALAEGRQHLDFHTEHRHLAPHTWSNLTFKAALTDRARSVYTGLIRIENEAPGSEAYQENRNLLLSERCRADIIPELEILNEDVSCSHGATAAPVDPEHLFYLQSRGLPAAEASRLVVRGFLEDALRSIPANLRGDVDTLLDERLARLRGVS